MAELVRQKVKKKISDREIEDKLSKLDVIDDEIGNYSQNIEEEATEDRIIPEEGNILPSAPIETNAADLEHGREEVELKETTSVKCIENGDIVKTEELVAPISSAPLEEFTQRIAECTLPRTYDSKNLKNFAFTGHVKEMQNCESWIAQESEAILSAQQTSTPNCLFKIIADYVKMMNEFVSLMHKLCLEEKEVKVLLNQLWVTEHKFGKKSGVCKDGFEVFLDYEYHTATFDKNDTINPKLQFLQRDNRHILCEQIPLVVSKVSLARLNIDNYLSTVISQCPTCSSSNDESPFIIQQESDLSAQRSADLKKLRAVVNVLFVSLRAYCSQHCKPPSKMQNAQENQGNFDLVSVADLHDFITDKMIDWIFLFVGLIMQESTMFDHLAISIHLLRLPSGILRRSSGRLISMIQLPGRNPSEYMPLLEKEHSNPIISLLTHPMVQVQIALFQLFFSSIKDRFRLLQLYSIEQHSIEELRSVLSWNPVSGPSEEEKALAAWTLVDSEGESDVSESQVAMNGAEDGAGPEEDPAYDHADLIMVSENTDQLSKLFHDELHPMQLEAFVGQLNLAQVFYAITQQTMTIWSAPSELGPLIQLEACCSGLLSLFAFIDQLIECLEQRSLRNFNQAGSKASASWRKVFKRNGSLLQYVT
ncbi:hypothetical protein Ciccas_005343 [Cichlidogyrus casuarinus]|uniref:Uncharacterized protein n=1 Tax=Cichlidogyrus casuarinus TaxID=1844966 RepID=A0ABD2QB78_9PLAT